MMWQIVCLCLIAGSFCSGTTPSSVSPQPTVATSNTTAPQNSTQSEADIEAVNALLLQPSGEKPKEDEEPDISSGLGGRSVLPRQQNAECQSPTGDVGYCSSVRECPGIYRIRDSSYLRRFVCGYAGRTPLVCCPNQWRTENYYGYQQQAAPRPQYNYGGYDNVQQPYYGNNGNYYGGQANYPRYQNQYEYPQYPQSYDNYSPYARPVYNFHFSTTTTTRRPRTTTQRYVQTQAPIRQAVSSGNRPPKPSFLPKVCGTGTGLSRIVGGSEAIPGSYPWMAAIYIQSGNSWLQACGGALVSNKHVVTAAHCVVSGSRSQNLPTRLFQIRLGDHNLESDAELPAGSTKTIGISKISRHSDFDSKNYKNDISIMELETPVQFSRYIQPVCLPYDGVYDSLDDEFAIVTGWGYTKYQGKGSDVLKQANIRLWPQNQCKDAFKKEVDITPEYLCAGDGSGKQDSCQGDSGGPLVYNEGTKFYLIGVVSFGKKCATPGYPGVYTRVSNYLDWLNAHF